jgi:hypothetical protein
LHEKLGIWLGAAVTSWPGLAFERSTVEFARNQQLYSFPLGPIGEESCLSTRVRRGNLLAIVLLGSCLVLGLTAGIFARARRPVGRWRHPPAAD